MIDVTVRPARPQDAADLLALSREAIAESAAAHYDTVQRRAWAGRRTLEQHLRMIEETATVVALADGDLAGFASLALAAVRSLQAGEVDQLFVRPRFGGRGVARTLLEAVAESGRQAWLASLVTHASWRAVPVFEHLGYARERVETVDVDGVGLTRVRMRLRLSGPGAQRTAPR